MDDNNNKAENGQEQSLQEAPVAPLAMVAYAPVAAAPDRVVVVPVAVTTVMEVTAPVAVVDIAEICAAPVTSALP